MWRYKYQLHQTEGMSTYLDETDVGGDLPVVSLVQVVRLRRLQTLRHLFDNRFRY
jgi:hypothetical protein